MKNMLPALLSTLVCVSIANAQKTITADTSSYKIIKTQSRIPNLKIALIHHRPAFVSEKYAVLLLHGSSFSSGLSFGFKMNNYSWIDNLVANGYEVYALDFLGYGYADRYSKMYKKLTANKNVLGRASVVCKDVDNAVNLILKNTKKSKVCIIGHSWGGSVAALYTSKHPHKVAKLVLFAAITPRNDTSASEKISTAYEKMTPEERIKAMKNLTPEKEDCRLDPEVFEKWGSTWQNSDPIATKYKQNVVRFPSGPLQDVEDMLHNRSYYNAADIKVPILLVRGAWDKYPSNEDNEKLFSKMINAPYNRYVIIEKGTHVVHLEKSRYQLYEAVLQFLNL
jgi:pimeloyl-ACP methyl ester carboxylesterase